MNPSLIRSAFIWRDLARDAGCPFDVDAKAVEALSFCTRGGAQHFGIVSKLEGTSKTQPIIRQRLQPHDALHLRFVRGLVVAYLDEEPIGYARPKHVAWLAPLVEKQRVRCLVLNITGKNHRWRGVNVAYVLELDN